MKNKKIYIDSKLFHSFFNESTGSALGYIITTKKAKELVTLLSCMLKELNNHENKRIFN